MELRMIFYDIESDAIRTKLAKKLEALGFNRIQYSVFIGRHSNSQWNYCRQQLSLAFEENIQKPDKLYFLQINRKSLKEMLYFGTEPQFDDLLYDQAVIWLDFQSGPQQNEI